MDNCEQIFKEMLKKIAALNEQLLAISQLLQFAVKLSETSLPALQSQQQEILRLAEEFYRESEQWREILEDG